MKQPSRPRPRGFTLVEVLVALFVMALMAALTWRGLDGVLRSRDAGRESVDRTQRLATLMSQWETDLQSLHRDSGVPAISFDGRTLRLVRRAPDGVQLVAWSLTDGVWRRWSSGTVNRVGQLQQAWLRSQQLLGTEPEQLQLLDGVQGWQLYFFRGNAWTNAQSTGDTSTGGTGGTGVTPGPGGESLPAAVRLQLQLQAGTLTRDIAVASVS